MPRCLNPSRFRWSDTSAPAHLGGSSGDGAQLIIPPGTPLIGGAEDNLLTCGKTTVSLFNSTARRMGRATRKPIMISILFDGFHFVL